MGRERWFHAEGARRVGPISRQQLVTTLITLAEPRQCRVWHRSLSNWTIAGNVPRIAYELDELLTPGRVAETAMPAMTTPTEVKPWWADPKAAIAASAAAVGVVALGLWLLLGRSQPPAPTPPPGGAAATVMAPAQPGSGVAQPGSGGEQAPVGLVDELLVVLATQQKLGSVDPRREVHSIGLRRTG